MLREEMTCLPEEITLSTVELRKVALYLVAMEIVTL
jgi:hypothetical protein